MHVITPIYSFLLIKTPWDYKEHVYNKNILQMETIFHNFTLTSDISGSKYKFSQVTAT